MVNVKMKKLNKDTHLRLGKNIKDISIEFTEIYNEIQKAYGRTSLESKKLWRILHLITSDLCNIMDHKFNIEGHKMDDRRKSPYYGDGKIAHF